MGYVPSYRMEIGPKMRKSLTLCLMGEWHSTVTDESSVMCLSSCVTVRVTSIHLQFRHFFLPYYCVSPPYIPFLFLLLLLSRPPVSCRLPLGLIISRPDERHRGPLAACASALVHASLKSSGICGTATDVNYIKQHRGLLLWLFYDYHCHKVQQWHGNASCTQVSHMRIT